MISPTAVPLVSPVGDDVAEHHANKKRTNATYERAAHQYEFAGKVAQLLIGYRMEHDLTQRQLAHDLRMTSSEISRLEGGEHTPSGKTMARILSALNKRVVFEDNVAGAGESARQLACV